MSNDFTEKDAGKIMEEYSGKSEEELYAEIMKTAEMQKQEGTFDKEGLNELEETLTPMLNAQQKEKLTKLLTMLRG